MSSLASGLSVPKTQSARVNSTPRGVEDVDHIRVRFADARAGSGHHVPGLLISFSGLQTLQTDSFLLEALSALSSTDLG